MAGVVSRRAGGRRSTTARPPLGRDLRVAVASGVALAVLFIATLFVNAYAFLGFIWLLAALGMLELDVVFRGRGWRVATPVALGVSLVLVFGAYANGPSAQSLGLVLLLFGAVTWTLLDRGRPVGRGVQGVAASIGGTVLMTLWVPFLASYAGLLLARAEGRWLVLATVGLTVAADVAAFAFGNRFGRHRLAPTVSPAKTWEGFTGGVLTVAVVAALVVSRLPGFDLSTALALAVVVAVAATVGDLGESMLKRDFGVKDLGTIVPGHGGIMDRADAVLLAFPAAHLLLAALGA